MFLSFFRVIKFSIQDIMRNIWLSLVTIIILILALFTVNMLLVVKVIGDTAIGAIKEKININVYVKHTATDKDIEILDSQIKQLPNVKATTIINRAQAIENFKLEHKNDPDILQSLIEIGQNPFAPTIVIKPENLEEFDSLISQLNGIKSDIIESRDFSDYKEMLNKINKITEKVNDAGIVLSFIFIFISILVVYNSVRVAIYTHKPEIMIMKLVGASNAFIQMPYLLSSFIYSCIGIAFIMISFYPFLTLLQPYLEAFFVGYNVNLISYFYDNVFATFGIQLLITVIVNSTTSLLAVRKYSKV